MGRVKHAGVGDVIQCGASGGASLWVLNVGDDTLHGPGPGGLPKKVGPEDHTETVPADSGHKLRVPPFVGGDAEGGFGGGGDVLLEDSEYGCTVY